MCVKLVSRFRGFIFVNNGVQAIVNAYFLRLFFHGGGGETTIRHIVAITLHQVKLIKIDAGFVIPAPILS